MPIMWEESLPPWDYFYAVLSAIKTDHFNKILDEAKSIRRSAKIEKN